MRTSAALLCALLAVALAATDAMYFTDGERAEIAALKAQAAWPELQAYIAERVESPDLVVDAWLQAVPRDGICVDCGCDSKCCSRTCACQDSDMLIHHYGKYCGPQYSGCPGEPACDSLDACCKVHDACVTQSGYGASCQCNVALVECSEGVYGNGACPSGVQATAATAIIGDICDVVRYSTTFAGGCASDVELPAVCCGGQSPCYPSVW